VTQRRGTPLQGLFELRALAVGHYPVVAGLSQLGVLNLKRHRVACGYLSTDRMPPELTFDPA